jgi:hypothetical protein
VTRLYNGVPTDPQKLKVPLMKTDKIYVYRKLGEKDLLWYETLEKYLVGTYGIDYLPLVSKLLAATSINSSLKSNIRLFRKALHEIENNLPFSDYLPVMKKQLEAIRHGRPLSGNKINAFAAAISGDKEAVVVDTWLLRAFEMDKQYPRTETKIDSVSNTIYSRKIRMRSGGATDKAFKLIEQWVREEAYRLYVEPRQLSAMIWSGVRIYHSGDRETTYIRVLEHQLFDMFKK